MILNYNSETKYTDMTFQTNDLCRYCDNCDNCPLLSALQTNIVYPCQQDFSITSCPMYNIDIGVS